MAALYEPAFAYAENALRDLQDAKLDGQKRDEGNALAAEVPLAASAMLDACLWMAQLRGCLEQCTVGAL